MSFNSPNSHVEKPDFDCLEWTQTREKLVAQLAEAQGKSKALIDLVKDTATLQSLIDTNNFTPAHLAEKFQVSLSFLFLL